MEPGCIAKTQRNEMYRGFYANGWSDAKSAFSAEATTEGETDARPKRSTCPTPPVPTVPVVPAGPVVQCLTAVQRSRFNVQRLSSGQRFKGRQTRSTLPRFGNSRNVEVTAATLFRSA